ncbi:MULTISPECIES: class I SAM-dependent methyltransferase [unclassified Streptomyces]|uniref:class I SAM-dependent methyltransferase n=1 Tax=unclassified Streptomyces TaxID=2593676 RepID=UPI00236680B4|nr:MULTISPECIES: class I SAM-dependent methyltransferase [unclassified Streptomyces]MDF3146260.1 class I SAM-dependent methyltransferase [Streptomyces sp. T21Q-yed]WDF42303.1 class I SAM-dependent methyltransferase [Streptomyces sp. T12]
MTQVARARWEEHFARGRGFRGVGERELRLLREAVRPRAGARALDIGCGLGTHAAALAGLGYSTLAVDWAEAAVAATRDRYADLEPRLRVCRLDFEDATEVATRLPRAGFDLVTMRLVLAFMADKRAVAERVRGLLAPGGTWVVTTPLADRLPRERRYIGVTAEDVAVVTEGWGRGEWYDLDAGGVRCFALRV